MVCSFSVTTYTSEFLNLGLDHFEKLFGDTITYCDNIDDCIKDKDICMIMTEWDTIKNYDIKKYVKLMHTPIIYDGRNCYSLTTMSQYKLDYTSMGRAEIHNL